MEILYCPFCDEDVPMLDEVEYAELSEIYWNSVRDVKDYRRGHQVALAETPLDLLYSPVTEAYERMTGATSYTADEIVRHHRLERARKYRHAP